MGDLECVYSIGYTYGYIRSTENEKYVIIANFDNVPRDIRLDVARYGISELEIVLSDECCVRTQHTSSDGVFFVDTSPHSFAVYKCR